MTSPWRRLAAGVLATGAIVATQLSPAAPTRATAPADASAQPTTAQVAWSGESVSTDTPAGDLSVAAASSTTNARLAGSPASFAFMASLPAGPVRYDPCQVVNYRVNLGIYHKQVMPTVVAALRQIGAATGLHFHYLGGTTFVPWKPYQSPTDADLVVAIAPQAWVPALRGSVIGMGGFRYNGAGQVTLGEALLEAEFVRRAAKGFASTGPTVGALLLHELGHAVGLGHVSARDQVMYPLLYNRSANQYQRGDLTGLARVGKNAGCLAR